MMNRLIKLGIHLKKNEVSYLNQCDEEQMHSQKQHIK